MLTTFTFRNWELTVDKEFTQQAYASVACGSPEECDCNVCKNFAQNREQIYPDEIKILFSQVGIDYRKESEICHYCRLENGQHFYGGWFHFKGSFTGKDCAVVHDTDGVTLALTPVTENFSIGFRHASALCFFKDRENIVQIEFDVKTDWVIDKTLEAE